MSQREISSGCRVSVDSLGVRYSYNPSFKCINIQVPDTLTHKFGLKGEQTFSFKLPPRKMIEEEWGVMHETLKEFWCDVYWFDFEEHYQKGKV